MSRSRVTLGKSLSPSVVPYARWEGCLRCCIFLWVLSGSEIHPFQGSLGSPDSGNARMVWERLHRKALGYSRGSTPRAQRSTFQKPEERSTDRCFPACAISQLACLAPGSILSSYFSGFPFKVETLTSGKRRATALREICRLFICLFVCLF